MTSPRTSRNLALLVAGTFFMENLDGTIVTTAAPAIGSSLGVSPSAVGVTITAYLLTLAVLVPISGWITRRFGARRVFVLAIVVFTVGSILCALSADLLQLTAFRVLQAAGGAMMVPVGRLVVLGATERKDVLRAIALLTWPALAAPVIAPLAGGIIVTVASWHWIFLINVPLGAVAIVAALRLMPRTAREGSERLDWLGFVLIGLGLGLLVGAGSALADGAAVADGTAGGMFVPIAAAAGAALTILAVLHLLRARHPLLDLRALGIPSLRVSNAGGSVFRLTISAMPFLLPLLFQESFGLTPVLSGTLVLFLFVGNLAIKPATTGLIRRFGFRAVIVAATGGAALSMFLTATLGGDTPLGLIIVLMVFSGVVRSVGFTAYNSIAFADVPAGAMTEVNTLTSTLQQLAAGLGVAVGALALRFGEVVQAAGASAAAPDAAPAFGAYPFAFVLLGILTLVATVEALRAPATIGAGIRPPRS
ncbi:MFS transporter [Subtercola boreus]|nr:MFS transporter [Subtercola boreus]TQL55711.1 EmrB/QacA subfamily drug resistance transporter [Subtercola boreus]